jgi:hypothetical protein
MSAAFVVAAARKDVARRLRDPFAFLLWLGIPLVLGGLMALLNSGGGKPRGRLLLADRDETFLSKAVAAAFAQEPLSGFFDVEAVEEVAGRARMDSGGASALVVIPKGFARAVLEDEPATIEVVKNPAQRILPAIAEETLGLLSEAVFYVQRVAGDRLREQMRRISEAGEGGANPWTEAFASDFGAGIHGTIERLSKYLSPVALAVGRRQGSRAAAARAERQVPRHRRALLPLDDRDVALLHRAGDLGRRVDREARRDAASRPSRRRLPSERSSPGSSRPRRRSTSASRQSASSSARSPSISRGRACRSRPSGSSPAASR